MCYKKITVDPILGGGACCAPLDPPLDGGSVWTEGVNMLKNIPYLVKFDHCIIVSL